MELEIILNGITRSFKPPPKTFLEFEYQLVDTFHLVSLKDCDIKYQDLENDMITISNNEEYTYMLNFFKSQNYKIIQIFVKEKSQSQILYSNSHNFENLKEEEHMIREIHFDSSLNLENNDTPKNFFKDKPVIKKFLKKDDTDFGLIESFLEKKESSDQFESKIPYSNIPCLKCKGIGRKNDKEVCPKCDGSGKMKNSKKLKKIEYLIEKKLQALLTEIANRKKQSEIQKPTLSDIKDKHIDVQSKLAFDPIKYSLPLNLIGDPNINNSSMMIHKGFVCDGCKMKPIIGFRFHCIICKDFDFCEKCEEIFSHPHSFIKIRKALDENRSSILSSLSQSQSLMLENTKEYKAQTMNVSNNITAFVKKTYTNSISIKNNGTTKWPDNTELKCISGLYKDTSEGIPSLNVAEEYKANLVLQAPNNPGIYSCSWKLSYRIKNDICFFGPKIDFNITVEEDPIVMEKMFVEKAKELKKLLDGKDSGDIQNYMEVVKKYEKYSIQELHKIIMEKAKENKTVIEK